MAGRSLVPRPHPQKEGKGSGELGLNYRFSIYGMHQQSHAKLGSDWSLWHVIVGGKANLEPDWSVKLNSLYCYTVMLHSCGKFAMWLSRAAISLARGNSSAQVQGFCPSSPDPFPPWRWDLGTRRGWSNFLDYVIPIASMLSTTWPIWLWKLYCTIKFTCIFVIEVSTFVTFEVESWSQTPMCAVCWQPFTTRITTHPLGDMV